MLPGMLLTQKARWLIRSSARGDRARDQDYPPAHGDQSPSTRRHFSVHHSSGASIFATRTVVRLFLSQSYHVLRCERGIFKADRLENHVFQVESAILVKRVSSLALTLVRSSGAARLRRLASRDRTCNPDWTNALLLSHGFCCRPIACMPVRVVEDD